jgi:hypothetical protein
MTATGAIVLLDGRRFDYRPGDRLSGRYGVSGAEPGELKAVEVSVHWFTEGKGETDVGVHHSEKHGDDEAGAPAEGTFATTLPAVPWSYDGLLVNVVWCVQVRATPRTGEPVEGIAYFRLGNAARAVEAGP